MPQEHIPGQDRDEEKRLTALSCGVSANCQVCGKFIPDTDADNVTLIFAVRRDVAVLLALDASTCRNAAVSLLLRSGFAILREQK
jgi:hypothetical protein